MRTYLILPRCLYDLFSPVEKILLLVEEIRADTGTVDRSKDPHHSSGGPTVASRPELVVLPRTKRDVLPQLGLGILEVITIQSTLVISGLQEGGLGVGLVVGTEVGDEWRGHVYKVGPVGRGCQGG